MSDNEQHLPPEKERARRLESHRASMAHRGPNPGESIRQQLRGKMGDEAPLVRKLYDLTANTKRSRRRKS